MVELRPMGADDLDLLARWDADPDVQAALGGPALDWYDWPTELARDVAWRQLLIAHVDGEPFGFLQLLDAQADDEQYWGDVEPGTWSLDIWIGAPDHRGRGLGRKVMELAIDRVFGECDAASILIDPMVTNTRAIAFYERLGFDIVGVRRFDSDDCMVMRLDRASWSSGQRGE